VKTVSDKVVRHSLV